MELSGVARMFAARQFGPCLTRKLPVIHWFRRDLRIADNTALCRAAKPGIPVVPVYILSDWRGTHHWTGPNRQHFLCGSLESLAKNLETLGWPSDHPPRQGGRRTPEDHPGNPRGGAPFQRRSGSIRKIRGKGGSGDVRRTRSRVPRPCGRRACTVRTRC